MSFFYTDEQLNYLNKDQAVYSVNNEFSERRKIKHVVSKEKIDPKNETNTLTSPDGQEFRVIATKSDPETGFDGLAVAPIVNGEPDFRSVAVIAAGTDPNSSVNKIGGVLSRDVGGALAASRDISPQYEVADQFVKELIEDPRYHVSKLSGYSQGSYMLKVGAKYFIPTTTFNTWFKYRSLTEVEKETVRTNKEMFVDYRKKNDDVVFWNDYNHPEWSLNKNTIKLENEIYLQTDIHFYVSNLYSSPCEPFTG